MVDVRIRRRTRRSAARKLWCEALERRRLLAGDGIQAPDDVGDTLESAQRLEIGSNGITEVAELIGNNDFGAADVDLYSLDLAAGDVLFGHMLPVDFLGLPAAPEPPGSIFAVRVFDAEGHEVARSHNLPVPAVGPILPDTVIEFIAESSGTYFVGVSGVLNTEYDPRIAGSGEGSHFGGYLLSLVNRHPEPSDDFGDTLASAESILIEPSGGVRLQEVIGNNQFGPHDVDLVSVPLAAGDILRSYLTTAIPVPSNVGLGAGVLRVFDARGEQLAVSIGGPQPEPLPADGAFVNVSVEVVIPHEGIYYVGVSSFPNVAYNPREAGSGEGQHVGQYILHLQRDRVRAGEDVGDTLSDAQPIEIGPNAAAEYDEFLGNNRFGPNDVDLYRLRLAAGDALSSHVVVRGIAGDVGGLIGVLRAFDSDGRELASSFGTLPTGVIAPTLPIHFEAPADGVYYVGVSSFPNAHYDPNEANSGIGNSVGEYVVGFALDRVPPARDAGDTLPTAVPLALRPDLHAHVGEVIGNNRFHSSDVDLYRVRLQSGDGLLVHLSAEFTAVPGIAPVVPQGALRLFDVEGRELAVAGGELLPEGAPPTELLLDYRALVEGDYFVGVSTAPNSDYDPLVAGSGLGVGLGSYTVMLHLEPSILPDDVGDTLATAAEFRIDDAGIGSVEGYIGNNRFGAADVDMYAFALRAGDTLAATLYHSQLDAAGFLPGLLNGVVRAFDSSGEQLAISLREEPGDFSNVVIEFQANTDGRYFVGVSSEPNREYDPFLAGTGKGEEVGSFLLDVRLDRADPVADAGDTLATARRLAVEPGSRLHLDEVVGNNEHGPADVDLYRIEAVAGDRIRANLVSSFLPVLDIAEGALQGLLRAFDASGNELATSAGPTTAADGRIRPLVSIEFTAPADGSYFVGVSSRPNAAYDPQVAGSGVGESEGHYFLGLDIDREPATRDVGDTLATAANVAYEPNRQIELQEVLGNNRFGPNDVDIYRVELAAGDLLRVVLSAPPIQLPAPVDLVGLLRVFDAAGTQLATSLSRAILNRAVVEFAAPADGEYFVGVSSLPNFDYDPNRAGSGQGRSVGPYQLELQVRRRLVEPDIVDGNRVPPNRPRLQLPRLWDAALRERTPLAGGNAVPAVPAAADVDAAHSPGLSVASSSSQTAADLALLDGGFEVQPDELLDLLAASFGAP